MAWAGGWRVATWQAAPGGTTPDTAGKHGGLSHLAFFYGDEHVYTTQLTAFADAGLANGEPVFIAVPGRRGGLLREHLAESGPQLREHGGAWPQPGPDHPRSAGIHRRAPLAA